jgi:RimJ/RimL family protein N-acetyltransferase
MQLGLKLGSTNINYTEDILSFFETGYFQYIELFAAPGSFNDNIGYWKQFPIPIIIHAPHSFAGMNLSLPEERENNKKKLKETFQFADAIKSEIIIFHSGVNGKIEETIIQLKPFVDSRCVIENKPMKGLNGEKCLGTTPEEIKYISNMLQIDFCLDFGHAICAANSIKEEPIKFIKGFLLLNPRMYHLTDGDYSSEYDSHLHYEKGNYPLKELIKMLPDNSKVTNEAKNDVNITEFKDDCFYFMSNQYLRKVIYSDIDILYEWANDPETRINSFNQSLIPYDTHKKWFEEKLKSNSTLFFIYHNGDENIGQVRFEIDNDKANINYSINPIYRGKGYGYRMLLLLEDKIKREYKTIKCLLAEVKNENIGSQKIFKKLNYEKTKSPEHIKYLKNIS